MNTNIIKSDKVLVAASNHPLRTAIIDHEIEEGLTILELLSIVQPNSNLYTNIYIEIDGIPVQKKYWELIKPKAGHLVSINIVPTGGGGGGGKNPLRTLLTIAVITASFYFGGTLGTALIGSSTFTIGSTVISSSVLGSTLITIAGGLLLNLIAPIRPATSSVPNKAESPSYFIDQARNNARLYGAIPVVFGRIRQVPPLGAQTVTEVIGGDHYLRMLVVWGYGPLRISDIKIGNTPIAEFDDIEIETRTGRMSDAPLTLYSKSIDQDNLSIVLEHEKQSGDPRVSTGGQWQVRRSGANANELSIDITFPRGIAKFNSQGRRTRNSIKLEIQYKKVGSNTWNSITPDVTATSYSPSWIINNLTGQIAFTGARTQPIRHGIRWKTKSKGQYDIRLRKFDYDTTSDRVYDIAIWSALRTINSDSPINFPRPLAVSALRIRATNQLAGAVSELNGIVESESLIWDGTSWAPGYTSNPASIYRLAIQHPARPVPEKDSNIDLVKLAEFYTFCDDKGYTFNDMHDQKIGLWDMLSDICAVGRASPSRLDNKFSVIIDTGTQLVNQHFTPVNSSDFKFYRSFAPPIDGVKIAFANEDKLYIRDERIVYNDGKNDTNSIVVPELSPTGITNKEHAYKFGRFHIAQSLLRREVWTLNVNFEYLVAQRGSRVSVQHDAIAVGVASARIIGIIKNISGDISGIKVDVPIYLEKDISYSVKIRTLTDANIVKQINERDGEYQIFTFKTVLNESLNIEDIVSIGESGYITIDGLLMAIEAAGELTAKLSIVPYQESIYNAETGLIPDFVSGISLSDTRLPDLIIVAIYADVGSARLIGDVYEPGIYIAIQPINHLGVFAECEIRADLTDEPYEQATIRNRANDSIELGNVEIGTSYDIRVRWNANNIKSGNWTERTAQIVSGNVAPNAPTSFVVTEGLGNLRGFGWISPNIPDFAGVKIKYSTNQSASWDAMTGLFQGIALGSPYETSIPNAAGTYYFEIRSVDTAGNESISGKRINATLKTVQEGIDGQPGNRGLAGYSNSISRSSKTSSHTVGSSNNWYKSGTTWAAGNRILSIGGVSTVVKALFNRIGDGALVTLYRDADNWADYTVSSISYRGSTTRAQFILAYIESVGVPPSSGAIELHFTVSGEDGATWHTGLGVPSSGLGSIGDFYFRQSNGFVYEKTTASTWTYRSDLTGPQGEQGPPGSRLNLIDQITVRFVDSSEGSGTTVLFRTITNVIVNYLATGPNGERRARITFYRHTKYQNPN